MNFKKLVAFTMAATMVLGSSLTAFAGEPTEEDITTQDAGTTGKTITGTGSEAFVNKNVLKVTVPTTLTNLFDYKVDPQGLVAETGKYDGVAVTGDTTGVVFKNAAATSGGTATISNTSDPVVVTNKSAIPVEMGIEVTVTAADSGLALTTLADSADFTTEDNKTKALYLGLQTPNSNDVALNKASVTAGNILLDAADQYETTWDTTGNKYKYDVKEQAEFEDFEFTVTGAINKALANSTWATVGTDGTVTTKNPPALSVKFTLTGVKDALPLGVAFIGDDLWLYKVNAPDLATDGGFGTTAPTAITLNGKTITPAAANLTAGYYAITFSEIAQAFGVAEADVAKLTDAEKTKIKNYCVAVKAVATDTYYGEVAR